MSHDIDTLRVLARYPFMKEAVEYVKNIGVSLEDVLMNTVYARSRAMGKEKVIEALQKGRIEERVLHTYSDYINELLSYIVARMLVSCVGDNYLIRRYAIAEAKTFHARLEHEDATFIVDIAREFGMSPFITDDGIKLHFAEYLQWSAGLSGEHWKLVNRNLVNGYVTLTPKELARLVQEAIVARTLKDLPTAPDTMKEHFKHEIADIVRIINTMKKRYDEKKLEGVKVDAFPPCMKHLIAQVQQGINISHTERFALASFLNHVGMKEDEILSLFATIPDFDVSKARYQIEHIIGKISGTVYTPPSCATMRTNSICYEPDNLCAKEWLKHPLTYYKMKVRRYTRFGKQKQTLNERLIE